MKNFSVWRMFLASVVLLIIATIVHNLDALVAMDYYTNPEYFSVWSKLMMPNAGPPPTSFFALSALFTFIGSLIFVIVYFVFKNAVPGKSLLWKGLMFGFLMFLMVGVYSALSMILIINLPFQLIVLWTAEDLIIKLVGGITTAYIVK